MSEDGYAKLLADIRAQGVARVGKRTHFTPADLMLMEKPDRSRVAFCGAIIKSSPNDEPLPYCRECLFEEVEYNHAVSDAYLRRAADLTDTLLDVTADQD